jgi:hypothetical protein
MPTPEPILRHRHLGGEVPREHKWDALQGTLRVFEGAGWGDFSQRLSCAPETAEIFVP